MKEALEIIAQGLDKLKASNPFYFVINIMLSILLIIAIDTVDFFQENFKEGFLFIKYTLIAITGFSSSSTFNYLPKNHPKKQNISLIKTINNDDQAKDK